MSVRSIVLNIAIVLPTVLFYWAASDPPGWNGLIFAAAKVEKGSQPTLGAILPALRCPVCTELIRETHSHVERLRRNATKAGGKKWVEEDVLEALDAVCNPYTTLGSWLRQLIVTTQPASVEGQHSVVVERSSDFGRCLSPCWTAAEACQEVLDNPDQDELSGVLYRGKKGADKLVAQVCKSPCRKGDKAAVARIDPATLHRLHADRFTPIDNTEMEMEEMMERMRLSGEGGPGMEVYKREEMMEMQEALRRGDKSAVEAIDPTMEQLSQEEFEMLREMQRADAAGKGEGPSPADAAAAEGPQGATPPDVAVPADGGWWGSIKRLLGW